MLTPHMRQSKTLLTIDECGSKIARNSVSIAICRQSGDKWQLKTLFLTIFDLRSSMYSRFRLPPIRCDAEVYSQLEVPILVLAFHIHYCVYIFTEALASLRICTDSSRPSLLADVISSKIPCSFRKQPKLFSLGLLLRCE